MTTLPIPTERDLTPEHVAILRAAEAGRLVLLDPWLGRGFLADHLERYQPLTEAEATALDGTGEGIAYADREKSGPHEAISFEDLDALIVSGFLRVDRSAGTLFVCVLASAPLDPRARLTALSGLPSRYHGSIGQALPKPR